MSEEHAICLAEFIKDHDKRFEAKAKPSGSRSYVLLTLASDGTALEPIDEISVYREIWIEQNDPGPTVHMAWQKWRERADGG